jgi:5-methylcytosine-specific restriction endonuclease McrA
VIKRRGELARGAGLARKTPLAATSSLRARPMPVCIHGDGCTRAAKTRKRGLCARHDRPARTVTRAPARAPARTKARGTGIPASVRAGVLARAGGLCEGCGHPLEAAGTHLHHRIRRRDGGHTFDNLVALHPLCHVLGPLAVHERVKWARARGLTVRVSVELAAAPLVLPSGRVVLLDPVRPVYVDTAPMVA